MGKLVRRTVAEHLRLNQDHSWIGPAVELTAQASFSPLELSNIWRKSGTKASFSHLPLSDFEDVSYESFVFTSSTFTFCGKSPAHASFSQLQLSAFQGSLARNAFLRDSRCTKCCVLQHKTSRNMDGEACPADGCGTRSFDPGSFPDRPCSGTDSSGVVLPTFLRVIPLRLATQSLKAAVELTVQASFCRCSCAAGQRKSGWWFNPSIPLKNISQLGWSFPIYGKIKNVPNHQPEIVLEWLHQGCDNDLSAGFLSLKACCV